MLGSVLTKTLRDHRRSVVGWLCGLSFLVLLTVAFWPSVEGDSSLSDFTEDLPEGLQAVVGSDISSPEGYLNSQLFTFMLPLLIAVLAIGKAAGTLAGEEQSGQLELLLAQPVSRARTVTEKGTAVLGVVAVVVAATFLVTVAGAAAFGMDVGVGDLLAAHFGLALLGFVFAGLALLAAAVTGRRGSAIAAASVVAAAFYFVATFAPLVDPIEGLQYVSPWNWAFRGDAIAEGPTLAGLVGLAALAVALLGAARWRFDLRDVGT
jgi:ABC-2 type transport system permease protein